MWIDVNTSLPAYEDLVAVAIEGRPKPAFGYRKCTDALGESWVVIISKVEQKETRAVTHWLDVPPVP